MAENFGNSSQESLILSQETYNSLWSMMDISGRDEMLANISVADLASAGVVPVLPVQPQVQLPVEKIPSSRSSLPATSNWPGAYDFKLLFGQQEKITKHTTWTYSELDNKLYVRKGAVCPFSFQTNAVMSNDVILRAMAVFSSPEHASEVVTRCVNHSQQELIQGKFEAEHLIRSESEFAHYVIDSETKRHSVILRFENPPDGQTYSTYIYKFVCFGSCAGGPNRRPLTLIFTLEQGHSVLGRITVDLKICACPGRDRTNFEKERMPQPSSSVSAPKKVKTEPSNISIPQNFFENFPKKKKYEEKPGKENEFIIRVKDRECYNFLNFMKKLFQTHGRYSKLSPEVRAIMQMYRSSSDEDERA